MTKKELLQKKITELKSMAKELGLSIPRTATKEEIATFISKALRLKTLRAKRQPQQKEPSISKPPKAPRKAPPVRPEKVVEPELKPVRVEEERPVSIPLPVIKDLLGLVPVNQQLFYLYWELSSETIGSLKEAYRGGKLIIRIHDLTGGRPVEESPFFDLQIPREEGGLHIDMGRPGEFFAVLGIVTKEGRFVPVLRSNIIRLPEISLKERALEAVRISFPSGIVHPTSF